MEPVSVQRKGKKREKYTCSHEPLEFPSCRVCGKKSTGIHFGVYSCEACKVLYWLGPISQWDIIARFGFNTPHGIYIWSAKKIFFLFCQTSVKSALDGMKCNNLRLNDFFFLQSHRYKDWSFSISKSSCWSIWHTIGLQKNLLTKSCCVWYEFIRIYF